jgi:pimeloyl-ACP methyl ester carboxylesterase
MPHAAGLNYFVHPADRPDAPAMILVHGAGGTHLHWPTQVRRLAGSHVYAPDLPGHGGSPGPGRSSVGGYVSAILAFMDALAIEKAVLVGHSMGSAVVMGLGLEAPHRVLALALLGAASSLRVSAWIKAGLSADATFSETIERIVEYSYSTGADPRLKELARQRASAIERTVWLGDFQACDAFDATAELGRLGMPAFVLAAAQDRMTPARGAERLRELLPHARLEVLDGAGHMMMLEKPDAVAAALGTYLQEVSQLNREFGRT